MTHRNLGKWQVIWWPRKRLWFFRAPFTPLYDFVIYVWPIEIRRFH